MERSHFPADIDEWLNAVIPAEGDDWVELQSMPPAGGATVGEPRGPAAGAGRREGEWPEAGREEETVCYHPGHMLLYFLETGAVYRLCFSMTGRPPRPVRAAGAVEAARRLLAPSLGRRSGATPRELQDPAPAMGEGKGEVQPGGGASAGEPEEGAPKGTQHVDIFASLPRLRPVLSQHPGAAGTARRYQF